MDSILLHICFCCAVILGFCFAWNVPWESQVLHSRRQMWHEEALVQCPSLLRYWTSTDPPINVSSLTLNMAVWKWTRTNFHPATTYKMQSNTATPDPATDVFFGGTLRYIQLQKQNGGGGGREVWTNKGVIVIIWWASLIHFSLSWL